MKGIVSIVLIMAMLFSLLPTSSVYADVVASGTCGDNLTWELDSEGTLTISGSGEMDDYSVLTMPWKYYVSQIKAIVIQDGVTNIGESAFYNCKNLSNVSISSTVMNIGEFAFEHCTGLTKINIPSSVVDIGKYAFSWCENLNEVSIPSSVNSIRVNAP